ncbi:DOPA 4,5-dioxygenase family protein [Halomonas cupida]
MENHALTGDDLADHTKYAYWLGDSVEVNLDGL